MSTYKVPELNEFQWQTPVTNQTTNTPPAASKGDRYIVGSTPTDAWVGYSKYIATYNGSTWDFVTPSTGMICYITAEALFYTYSGSAWVISSVAVVGLFDIDVDGNLEPITGTQSDTNFDLDGNGDVEPK